MIDVEVCEYGDYWIHLNVQKLTHSLFKKGKEQARQMAKEHDYPLVFCLVPENKYKLALLWGFRLNRKCERHGKVYNIMSMETKNAYC